LDNADRGANVLIRIAVFRYATIITARDRYLQYTFYPVTLRARRCVLSYVCVCVCMRAPEFCACFDEYSFHIQIVNNSLDG